MTIQTGTCVRLATADIHGIPAGTLGMVRFVREVSHTYGGWGEQAVEQAAPVGTLVYAVCWQDYDHVFERFPRYTTEQLIAD